MGFGQFHALIAEFNIVTDRYGLQNLECVLFCLLRKSLPSSGLKNENKIALPL